jgi:hypothetical protein
MVTTVAENQTKNEKTTTCERLVLPSPASSSTSASETTDPQEVEEELCYAVKSESGNGVMSKPSSALPVALQQHRPRIAPPLPKIPVVPEASALLSLNNASSKLVDFSKDSRIGIVVEAGTKHFDHKNRLHQERPIRVTAIAEALQSNGLLERCCVIDMDSSEQQQAETFLQDDDYLRVHLPGYIQR